jgi:hypothetical protein
MQTGGSLLMEKMRNTSPKMNGHLAAGTGPPDVMFCERRSTFRTNEEIEEVERPVSHGRRPIGPYGIRAAKQFEILRRLIQDRNLHLLHLDKSAYQKISLKPADDGLRLA